MRLCRNGVASNVPRPGGELARDSPVPYLQGPASSSPNLLRVIPATTGRTVPRSRLRLVAVVASAAVCLLAALCYTAQPDPLAALTHLPPWVWAVPGLILVVWQLRRPPRRAAFAALLLWVLYLGVFEEETRSLLRRPTMSVKAFDEARAQGKGLRLVSANCAGGQPGVALEAAGYDPDILVLEESPPDQAVADLAAQLFGGSARVAQGPDVAIIARGQVAHIPRKGAWYLTAARAALSSGVTVSVIGAHLTPPVFELGLLSSDYWRAQQRNRKIRRDQTQEIAHLAAELAQSGPAILAGDLNCPAGDASLRPLLPLLHDAFREGGVGWGNTVLNEYPVMRFDQVWCSGELRAVRVRSVRSRISDHRIVVADLVARESTKEERAAPPLAPSPPPPRRPWRAPPPPRTAGTSPSARRPRPQSPTASPRRPTRYPW